MSCLLHGLRMRMGNCSELPPCACMSWRDAKTLLLGSAEYLSAAIFVAGVLVPHYVAPSRARPGREAYRLFICSRWTSRRGIHAEDGHCLVRAFGTNGPVT